MLQREFDLSESNTLALGGKAAHYVQVNTTDQLVEPELQFTPRFILGGGSNLVLSGDFDGLVLHMAIPGRAPVARTTTLGTCAPVAVRTGTTLCNGRWRKAGRAWKTCR